MAVYFLCASVSMVAQLNPSLFRRVRPPIEVEGMSAENGRRLLDKLEAHTLQPRFRYDHAHTPGDVTLWHNYMT